MQCHDNPRSIEITVISAEGIKTTSSSSSSSIFSRRLRPFIALSTAPPRSDGEKHRHVYETRVVDDLCGTTNPTWGDRFSLPVDPGFFADVYSGVYVHLYSKRLLLGRVQLGWCHVPAHDIGLQPVGSARFLSYRLRARDGSRTHGVINLSVKLLGFAPVGGHAGSVPHTLPTCQTVIGIPVGSHSGVGELSSTCQGRLGVSYTGL